MNRLEGFDPKLYTPEQITVLIKKGYTPADTSEIQNTNFINNDMDKAGKISKMISKEHNIVQNKYNGLQKQVEKINDISSTKLKNDKMVSIDIYKSLMEQNNKLTSILRKNESDLSNLNKKLEYTLNNINIHENESSHSKAVLTKPKKTTMKKRIEQC
jgi:hypothetical protein